MTPTNSTKDIDYTVTNALQIALMTERVELLVVAEGRVKNGEPLTTEQALAFIGLVRDVINDRIDERETTMRVFNRVHELIQNWRGTMNMLADAADDVAALAHSQHRIARHEDEDGLTLAERDLTRTPLATVEYRRVE